MRFFGRFGRLWGIGLGAGLLGAAAVALRHALNSPAPSRIPDIISPAIFATRVVRTVFGQILFHESGSGRPVIFLHGAHPGSSSYEWSKVYPEFAASSHVLAPDLIGFGESERPSDALGPSEQARALVEFIRQTCAILPGAIVGSHYGAALAVLLASQNPDLVERLVLFAPSGLTGKDEASFALAARLPLVGKLLYRRRSSHRAIRYWMNLEGFKGPPEALNEAVEVYVNCARQYRAEVAGIALLARNRLAFDFESRLADLPMPVSILWPSNSPSAPLQRANRIVGLAPRGTALDVLTSCGILAPLQNPGMVAKSLKTCLDNELRAIS